MPNLLAVITQTPTIFTHTPYALITNILLPILLCLNLNNLCCISFIFITGLFCVLFTLFDDDIDI